MHQLAGSSPYVVVPAEGGPDVVLDAVDARWTTLAYRRGLRKTVNDLTRSAQWSVGVDPTGPPVLRLAGSASFASGRQIGFSRGREYGLRDDGTLGVAAGWDFRMGEGRELVRWAAREQGWRETMPRDVKTGIAVAGVTVALLLVAGIVLGILALLGRL